MIKTKEKGLLIVVSGPSGCGKSTLNQLLLQKRENIVMSISDTTRDIRGKEIDGVDYNFSSTEQFENNIKNNKYLEYAVVHSNKYYGTPVDWVEKMLNEGNDVILEIDIEGSCFNLALAANLNVFCKNILCLHRHRAHTV